jgi:serine/threonine protein kinase
MLDAFESFCLFDPLTWPHWSPGHLQPETIFLHDTSDYAALKLGSFGFAQILEPRSLFVLNCGNWAYSAPEMSDPARPGYDYACDVYSMGVILCES